MDRVIKAIAVVVAVAATATAVQWHAAAAPPGYPFQSASYPTFYPNQTPSTSYGAFQLASLYPSPLAPYGYALDSKAYLDLSQITVYAPSHRFKSFAKLHQHTSLGRTETSAPEAVSRQSQPVIARIGYDAPVLAPMAYTRFCLQYPGECKVHKTTFRGGAVKLSAERRKELDAVNAEVNREIVPQRNTGGLAGEKWSISPKTGECHDYAVTKRHELMARGWPVRALLLAEVVAPSGEHHLVLVVRTGEGDLVADNLTANILSWSKTPYDWVRIQSPRNPKYWSSVANAAV